MGIFLRAVKAAAAGLVELCVRPRLQQITFLRSSVTAETSLIYSDRCVHLGLEQLN